MFCEKARRKTSKFNITNRWSNAVRFRSSLFPRGIVFTVHRRRINEHFNAGCGNFSPPKSRLYVFVVVKVYKVIIYNICGKVKHSYPPFTLTLSTFPDSQTQKAKSSPEKR